MESHVLFSLASRAQMEELGWELWVSVALEGSDPPAGLLSHIL